MPLPLERDPHITSSEPSTDTTMLDSSDDPWMAGNDDMTSAQDGVDDRSLVTTRLKPTDVPGATRTRDEAKAVGVSSLVGDPETLRRHWESVQVGFVDDPRRAVEDAERLVSGVVEELVDSFRLQRQALEESWSEGSDSSIDDLRRAFQRISRLL
jgi:hypothetical protein